MSEARTKLNWAILSIRKALDHMYDYKLQLDLNPNARNTIEYYEYVNSIAHLEKCIKQLNDEIKLIM
jgi:hypothetical protein